MRIRDSEAIGQKLSPEARADHSVKSAKQQ